MYVRDGSCESKKLCFKWQTGLAPPTVTDFSPKTAPFGRTTRVYIFGGGFTSFVNRVTIGGQSVRIIDRVTSIDVSGSIAVFRDTLVVEMTNCANGVVAVTNTHPNANNATATSLEPMVCTTPTAPAPTITRFSPTIGGPTTQVTIEGTNLQNADEVRIGRSPAQIISTNPLIVVPGAGGQSGQIAIRTPGGTAVSEQRFTFVPTPVVTSIVPTIIGPGTPVYIRGTNLAGNAGTPNSVDFGGVKPLSHATIGDTLIIATIGTSGTIAALYSTFPSGNIPVTVNAIGGSTIAPERITFVLDEYVRPSISIRPRNASGGARIDEATGTLFLTERRATFYPVETLQKGEIMLERRNWNTGVDVLVRISYVDANGSQMRFLRGISVDDKRVQPPVQIPFPIPPFRQDQLPNYPQRELMNIDGLWTDLEPTRMTTKRDSLRLDSTIIPIRSTRTFFSEVFKLDTTAISVRARWSDQLYPNNPEGLKLSDLSYCIGRQGRRRMIIQVLPSPVGQYDINPLYETATVVLDDPPIEAPAVINPVSERELFAGRTDSVYIEAPAAPGSVDVRPVVGGGVLPKDIFYDDNYLPLTYTVRSDNPTMLTVSTGASSEALGRKPFVRFTLSPAAISGSTAAVIITANNGLGGVGTHSFIVRVKQGAPVITSIAPEAGRAGSVVTIRGRDFGASPRVSFAGSNGAATITATPSTSNDTLITVQVPNGAETGKISVGNSISTTLSANDFVIVRTPQITGFTPDSAAQGTSVTIRGSNFRGANRVTFGGVAATSIRVVSDSEIIAVVSSGASGVVLVANPLDSGRSAQPFTFFPPPSIQSFTPTTSGAGSTITLMGLNFSGVGFTTPISVSIGGRNASFAVVSPGQLTVTVPDFGMMAMSNLPITVVTRGGETTATTRFNFIPCPSVDTFSPASGGVQTTLTIIGTGLQAVTGVNIGGVPVRAWSLASPTRIVVTVGSVESGEVQIIAGNCTITAAGRFSYQAPSRPLLIQPATFRKIFPNERDQGVITLTNQSAGTLNIGLALNRNDGSFILGTPTMLTLRRNESTQVSITFAPRSGGFKLATISATLQGTSATTVDTLQTAQAGVWQLVAVNFDTVRTGRSTLRSALVINRDTASAKLDAVRLPSDGAFRIAGTQPNWVGKGETAAIILRCQPSVTQQRLQSILTVEGAGDTASTQVSGFSRSPEANDIVLEARFASERNNLPSGQNTALRLEITNGQNIRGGVIEWGGSVRWSQTVLLSVLHESATKPASQGQFTLVRNSEPRNPFQRVTFPMQMLSGGTPSPMTTTIAATIPCGVYVGTDSASALEFEEMTARIVGSQQRVFVEEAQAGSAFGRFIAQTNGRIIQRVVSAALTVISPNPAQNLVSVKFALPKETAVVLSMVDARGQLIKTLAEGWFASGEHQVEFDASAVPNGAYMILLHTEQQKISRSVQLIR
ncbi:MAG: IPT/TIG domain-containing protein [Candidatus Kapaibacteriota bacterium]